MAIKKKKLRKDFFHIMLKLLKTKKYKNFRHPEG